MDPLQRKVVRILKNVSRFLFSRRSIPMLKGTLAYILAFVFIFLKKFDDLSFYPLGLSSMMIIVIASGAGKSVGACLQAILLGMAGVCLGSLGFVILAELGRWPVAQAFVFAFIVYLMALLKARGMRYFGLSLLCILNSFNGIYTSAILGEKFNAKYLEAYLTAYLWGGAISLGVNVLVFPYSSERELRRSLVTSLEHVGTLAHLLAKGYTFELTKEESVMRERLIQTIRADFGFLSQNIEETSLEINYSRFSMKQYQCFIARIRGLQQALITAHSSLVGVKEEDYDLFRERFLPSTLNPFNKMRRAVDLTIRDIGTELGCGPMVIPATQETYMNFMSSLESQSSRDDLEDQLAQVSQQLAAEVGSTVTGESQVTATRPSSTYAASSTTPPSRKSLDNRPEKEHGIQVLRREFDAYAAAQHDILQNALVSGHLQGATDGNMRLHNPRPSIYETYRFELGGIGKSEGDLESTPAEVDGRSPPSVEPNDEGEKGDEIDQRLPNEGRIVLNSGQSLVRVWGFLFAMEQFVSELETFWTSVTSDGIQPRRIHFHLFEALHRPHQRKTVDQEDELPLREALALLENKPYSPAKRNIWQALGHGADIIQSPTSVFAAKTAAATALYGLLIYLDGSRKWFINYSLTSGMLTIVVALAPTLGQSMLVFVLQIAGSGIGYLWSLAVLEMFRNVGGYTFNPYGLVCMIIPFALIMEYVLYNLPQFFVVAFLALNGCGVIVITEWIAVEHLHRISFDSPAFRTGKALTALTVALAIVAIFQLFILRNPARRTLRKQLAALAFDILSYTVLLQAFGRSVLSADPKYRPSKPALLRAEREIRHRELKLQSKLIEIMPLVRFAAAEPHFASTFKRDTYLGFIRSIQVFFDRVREARAALGTQQFEEFILTHFVSVLAPYRALHTRLVKAQLFLIAGSIQSKAPLPKDTPMRMLTEDLRADFLHDALVLGARFSKTEEGNKSIRTREFMRYMSFLIGWTSVSAPLQSMEDACKELFGELESKLI